MPANFRTYEGMRRLLTAVFAAHPELKPNHKEIAKHYGSDWTESGVEHFFRPVKKDAKAVADMVKRGEDAANFDHTMFQFRQIKKDAENMRQGKGTAPSSAASTPAKATPKTPKTPGGRMKRAAPASASKSSASKRVRREVSDDETLAGLNAEDLEMLDNTSSHVPVQEQTPTRPRTMNHEPPAFPPALDLTQASSPEENDDTLTPREDPAFSFAQTNSQPPALDPAEPWARYHSGPQAGTGSSYLSAFVKEEYEEDDGEV